MNQQAITLQASRTLPANALWTLTVGLGLMLASALAAAAQNRPVTFADLAEQVSPAVVNITTTTTVRWKYRIRSDPARRRLRLRISSAISWIAMANRVTAPAALVAVRLWARAL